MSSLLQFTGPEAKVTKDGVGLLFYETHIDGYSGFDNFVCPLCGKLHPVLHRAYRKPRGMFGCWVVFRYNREDHVPDLSIPIRVEAGQLPKGSQRLTDEASAIQWHS